MPLGTREGEGDREQEREGGGREREGKQQNKCLTPAADHSDIRGSTREQSHHHGGVQDLTASHVWTESQPT